MNKTEKNERITETDWASTELFTKIWPTWSIWDHNTALWSGQVIKQVGSKDC